jgi:aconitate hydratase
MPKKGDIEYSVDIDLDLSTVQPGVAGPKRPQDRINVPDLKNTFTSLLTKSVADGGYGKAANDLSKTAAVKRNGSQSADEAEMVNDRPTPDAITAAHAKGDLHLRNGSVLIAAITSCTNTSNPSVMIGAGLLAKKAASRGLRVDPAVKTSLAPGSRVVKDYLETTGLQPYLDQLGFQIVGYGCTTCIGNSGPLAPEIESAIVENDLVTAAVLSGNRNFEARIHQNIRANFLMSPPLVVAYALAGRVDIELYTGFADQNPKWNEVPSSVGQIYDWDAKSTYIQEPPFFENFGMSAGTISDITGARPMGIFGDSVTTDHISPAGAIKASSPAGKYLVENGIEAVDFNSYGSRRGNDRVMTRGTFANVRIKNLMIPAKADGTRVEGGLTIHQPTGEQMSIYDACMAYQAAGTPLIVFAGQEYGTGSSRDWAAKGTRLLGVKAVVAQSFERIHRSNLVGMGVLPLQFPEGISAQSLNLDGTETYDITGLSDSIQPRQDVTLTITRKDGTKESHQVKLRIDTPIEVDYYRHGGILPFVLRQLIAEAK